MALNLLDDKQFNDYLTDITYQGMGVPKQQNYHGDFESVDYVEQHRDEIVKGILNQYVKLRVRDYVKSLEKEPAFELVDKSRTDLPGWTEQTFARGEDIYEFNVAKMSAKLREDIIMVRDYLYDVAVQYVDKVIRIARETRKKPKIRYDFLKTSNEYATFEMVLAEAKHWQEHIVEEMAKRNKPRNFLEESLKGAEYVMDLPDGLVAYRLMTPEALDFESENMGHCVGRGGYDAGVKDGRIKIYSIRDKRGEPHATLEVHGKSVEQCKGKQDKKPIRKYLHSISNFIEQQGFHISNDAHKLGLIKQDDELWDIFNLPPGFVVNGDLDFSELDLTELPDLSTIIVKGSFKCSENKLTSLKGAPKSVGGSFECRENNLMSLAGAPQSVGGDFDCSGNQLTSLVGAPKSVGENFNCSDNQLTSLAGAPQSVGDWFNCSHNQLTSLVGAPQSVGDWFNCSDNQLTSLAGAPQSVGDDFDCSNNQLTSLAGAPQSVEIFLCSYNLLTDLKGAPQYVGLDFNCSHNQLTSLEGGPKKVRRVFKCSYNQLTDLKGAPQEFGEEFVGAYFDCSNNQLTSLEGVPQSIDSTFDCSENSLMSLKGAPKYVREFICKGNNFVNLFGLPEKIGDFGSLEFGTLENAEQISAPEYIIGMKSDIPPELLEIMVQNGRNQKKLCLQAGTEKLKQNLVAQNNFSKEILDGYRE